VHELIAWCGFLGAWFVVAGSIYQAALELEEENFEREEMASLVAEIERPRRPSPWWWLIPPVGYLLRRRNGRAYRAAFMHAMTPEQLERMVRLINKANGWMYVGLGGLLIATKETWELREAYEWPVAVFWILVAGMPLLCAVNTAARMARTRGMTATPA
jgi:hypothetical protein